jgi:hypothetical protein
MSYPINYPTPQGANVQIFNEGGTTSDWVKPQGASFVWFTLIGGGANGNGASTGGGSGAVTNFMCPAFLIPDVLNIRVGLANNSSTTVRYQQKDGSGYLLLLANTAISITTGATATAANAFTAMGFYQSIAGQDGTSSAVSASSTTFLSGGGNGTITANYGYSLSQKGVFQMTPIIVGVGGSGNFTGGSGCGGGTNGNGGNGMVVIITW